MPKLKKLFIRIIKAISIFFFLCIIVLVIFIQSSRLKPPKTAEIFIPERTEIAENHYTIENNWLKLNRPGMWEMYIEGDGYERGLIYGKLAKELVVKQEEYFVAQIKKMIPSKNLLYFLKYFIAIFNRNIDKHIPKEYLEEIYGVSQSASTEFNYIGSNYERILNYHAAHDIGHALANYMLVGCTSLAVWDEQSEDSTLLIGRNFDFYVGDDFSKEKIVYFVKPEKGIPFAMITWGGMIGAVSGMNKEGLTVTINAAKSDMPRSAATPISILAREILQYASTIDEAYAIANNRKTFVSESILVGSNNDGFSAIIEKSPSKISLYREADEDLVCTNHYQSDLFSKDEHNQEYITNSSTEYRYDRTSKLMHEYESLDYKEMALILRDRKGNNNDTLGMGNDFALNQLIAHHSIIFKPSENIFWISDYPYQIGAYLAYDLDEVFSDSTNINSNLTIDSLEIPADSFLYTQEYNNYKNYLRYRDIIETASKKDFETTLPYLDSIVLVNPDYFMSYKIAGNYFLEIKDFENARLMYSKALQKNGISLLDKSEINKQLEKVSK